MSNRTKTLRTDEPVVVLGDMPGFLQYTCADGYMGVSIVGEHGRIDEWHPCQVRKSTMKEVAELTVRHLGKN